MSSDYILQYRSLNPDHLLDDEIEHELLIRQHDLSRSMSRDAKKRKLRNLLKLQRELNNFDVSSLPREEQELEFRQVEEKLAKVRYMLENRKGKRKTDLPPFKTRLIHLLFRLMRLKDSMKFNTNGLETLAIQLLNDHFTKIPTGPDAERTNKESRNDFSGSGVSDSEESEEIEWDTAREANESHPSRRNRRKGVLTWNRTTSTPKNVGKQKKSKPTSTEKLMKRIMGQVDKYLRQKFDHLNLNIESRSNVGSDNRIEKERKGRTEDSNSENEQKNEKKNRTNRKSRKPQKVKKGYNVRREYFRENEKYDREEESGEESSSEGTDDSSSGSEEWVARSRRSGSSRQPRPVADWKLRYDGRDEGKRLNKFIAEVEFMAEAENISKRTLFKEAIHLFSGDVRTWYMEGKRNGDFRNWRELVIELKQEYQPPDLDFHYEQQAAERRQRRSEKFTDYYNAVKEIFDYMSVPPTEQRKFEIVFRNLRSDYKNALVVKNIRTLRSLQVWGRKLDSANWYLYKNKDNETARRSAHVHEVEQKPIQKANRDNRDWNRNLDKNRNAYWSNDRKNDWKNDRGNEWNRNKDWKQKGCEARVTESKHGQATEPNRSNVPRPKSVPSTVSPLEGNSMGMVNQRVAEYRVPDRSICFNCRGKNHHYKGCLQEKERFCTVCGFYNFTRENCPYCAKNAPKST